MKCPHILFEHVVIFICLGRRDICNKETSKAELLKGFRWFKDTLEYLSVQLCPKCPQLVSFLLLCPIKWRVRRRQR